MAKAKSRLQSSPKLEEGKHLPSGLASIIKRYKKQFPTLVLGLIFWLGVIVIVTTIKPDQLADTFIQNSYLPLLVFVFLALFFTLAFLLLHTRRAFIAALLMSSFIFLQVQQVIFTYPLLGVILIFFVILETGLSLIAYGFRSPTESST